MKKYLIITPEFGLMKGGIQSWAYYINKSFNLEGFECGKFAFREANLKDLLLLVRSYFNNYNYILMTWKMMVFLLPLVVFGRFSKAKISVIIHGNDFLNLSRIKLLLLKWFIRQKTVEVISNSKSIADMFERITKYKVDSIVYPFVDCPNVNDISNCELHSDCEIKLVTITRLVPRKNIKKVILAVSELIEEGNSISYLVGGAGPELHRLNILVDRLGLNNHIKFIGKVTEEDKWRVIKSSDAFVLPSLYDISAGSIEGYGIVYIEANAMGVPNISGDTGGAIEAVLDGITGIHTNGSIESIKNAILQAKQSDWDVTALIKHSERHSIYFNKSFSHLI